ncbi:Acyltransferase family protein associated with ethylmalonyl-CoA pathway [Olavius algarvensis associated proteobacterium Delta 3]|nr:Acyltransferase family protein associated with ethylmalonyl-CoA pathway [Olavius algarvensis associated proteobacterium Delta 3]
MADQVTISLWLFLVLVGISLLAVLDKILIPSTRWFIRRKINRVLNEISTRLDIEIRPFQLTQRRVLIDRLVYDTKVLQAVQDHAQNHEMPLEVAQKKALTYAREIVPSFNAYLYFRIGYWIAKKVARRLYRVRVGLLDNDQFSAVDPESTVVFVMNHRSNMDYVLVAFLAAERTTLSYAVGEWARIWPLQTLIRAMGAFFVRRNSGTNPLYRRILERYVHMATKEGVCQAVFLEGGLSRDGLLRAPKLGLVDYMLRSYAPTSDRDIVFIPVGVNYDRALEDRSLLRDLDPSAEKRSRWFVFWTTVRFIRRGLFLMVLNRWERYGYACVNFGNPVSMRAFCQDHAIDFSKLERDARFPEIQRLCDTLMDAVQKVIPALPVSLVATVFLESGETPLDIPEIEDRAGRLIRALQAAGGPVFEISRSSLTHVIAGAVHLLHLRRLLIAENDTFRMDPKEQALMDYYANAIAHWRPLRAASDTTVADRPKPGPPIVDID